MRKNPYTGKNLISPSETKKPAERSVQQAFRCGHRLTALKRTRTGLTLEPRLHTPCRAINY
jgi:hypothetical protein